MMKIQLNSMQWEVLRCLREAPEKRIAAGEISRRTDLDHSKVMGVVHFARERGWISVEEVERVELIPAADRKSVPVPAERIILPRMVKEGAMPLRELAALAGKEKLPMNEIIRWGVFRGWFVKEKGALKVTDAGQKALEILDDDEKALEKLRTSGALFLDDLQGIDPVRVEKLLQKRGAIAKIRHRTRRLVSLTEEGQKTLVPEKIEVVREKNRLSSEDIVEGGWRHIALREYDVTLPAEKMYPAKIHLMQKMIQQTRRAFLEMGFTEIVSPQAESAFWDFDALFQPQDHPARDMQDTFYLSSPEETSLPSPERVEAVRQTHENGGDTGSTGWGYRWSEEKARRMVLRTHTTASTVRALAENPAPPRKVFCVGKVFRNEAISYKHLPEFFQVDGIIIDRDASLATLLGTLSAFYRKMGFDRVKFKPAFFPYTEPSAEVFVYMESRKTWIELGGSGVFRPEVTRPLGCRVPVMAWGLGLDRLAMLRYGIDDIRELYWTDLEKNQEVSLCR